MKYMGSKNRIAKYIVPILEDSFHENECEIFIDACCGGCNVIDKVSPDIPRYANDINIHLIEMFKGLQRGKKYPNEISKEVYNLARNVYHAKTGEHYMDIGLVGWIGWMGSYNGRFFDGGYSGHNVKGRDYIGEQIRNTLKQMDGLVGVTFSCKSLFDISPKKKALLYFDIPYKGTKGYSSGSFDYDRFYDKCKELTVQGNVVFISEYTMPDDFVCVWEKEVTNSLNPNITYRPVEKLFTLK